MTPHEPLEPSTGRDRGEAEWITRAREGYRGAQERLLRDHFAAVHATAFRLTGNPEDAEDLAQECFVRAFRSLGWFRGTGSFAGWLRRILVHLAHDRYRALGPRPEPVPPAGEPESAGGDEPHALLEERELARVLADATEALPSELRLALRLRTREGLEYEEIGTLTGVTAETVRTRVMKARRALLRMLGPYLEGRGAARTPAHGRKRP